jgi:hypothetical protein
VHNNETTAQRKNLRRNVSMNDDNDALNSAAVGGAGAADADM